MRKKYQLPVYAELKDIKINLKKLQNEALAFAHKYIDVEEANVGLCDNHKVLVSQVYKNFEQINLTELNGEVIPYTDSIKERLRRGEEKLYNKPTEDYLNSYFKEITDQFVCDKMRVRITKLDPGSTIPFHIDYDPTYAVRIIVPIHTDIRVTNLFKVKGERITTYLEEGKAYFLNVGFAHAVYNNSDQPRIALMFSLDGQDDIDHL